MDILIERPQKKNIDELKQLFEAVITNNFKTYGFYEKFQKDIAREVNKQIVALEIDINSHGKDAYFLIAKMDKKIVGTIAYGKPSSDIERYYKADLNNIPEIKSAYVSPEYQGNGMGTILLNEMIKILQGNGFKEFILDSGYPNAQQFWKKKLGEEPVITIVNRWVAGNNYMIWHKKLS